MPEFLTRMSGIIRSHSSKFAIAVTMPAIVFGLLPFSQQVQAKWGAAGGAEAPVLNPTATDVDGDGIPDTWEVANSHNKNDPTDATSDFDFDGLTAKQEYDLSVTTAGQYGKPLGTYQLTTIPDPSGYASISTATLIETAKNGMSLVRVVGVLNGSSSTTTRIYTYYPATGVWTWVMPPSSVPSTAALIATDINSRGQVVGYYGSNGFLWTPSISSPSTGTNAWFFINPTASTPTPAFPRRISDTGYLLYSTGSPSSVLKAADPAQLPIVPLVNSWTNPTYLDVNDYGEYVGTIYSPINGLKHTFLAIPNGPFFLSAPTTSDLADHNVISALELDESSIQWDQIPTFVYPDDFYDEDGNYRDPYDDYPEYYVYEYGTALVYGVPTRIRKDRNSGVIYWKQPGENTAWNARTVTLDASSVALNDWGEFAGGYTVSDLMEAIYFYEGVDEYGNSYEYSVPYNEQYNFGGAFMFDGGYHFTGITLQICGMSNDPQILLSNNGSSATHVWSDSVVAPISKLLPSGSGTYTKTEICDNGVLILQKSAKVLQILTPSDDADSDGMPDDWEKYYGFNPNDASDASADADQDGISNLSEFKYRSNPQLFPIPGTNQYIDLRPGIDTDGDGMPNTWEWKNGLAYDNPADAGYDKDSDGLTNLREYQLGTDPNNADTDNDGIPDGAEVQWGYNPTHFDDPSSGPNQDPDGDGLTNQQELLGGTNPMLMDTDGDGIPDGIDPLPLAKSIIPSSTPTALKILTPSRS